LNGYPFLATYQTGTYHPRTGKIYFLGGFYHTNTADLPVPLSYAITYDTLSAAWENKTLKAVLGSDMPSARQFHTATLCMSF
jgi:hypothetical protein